MGKSLHSDNQCPVGAKECSLIAEIDRLRAECRKLEELSYVDALTGMYNFRYLQRSLEMEMARTRRTKLPTGLIMIDLDHFRRINTEYGHEAGNTALSFVAKILREGVRLIDIPCRYGGEEFALILPSTSLVQALNIAERLRAALNAAHVLLNAKSVTITASFGVAVFRHVDEFSTGDFLRKADELLFRAKSSGRNRVCAQDLGPAIPVGVTAEEKEGLFASDEPHDKED